MASISEVEGEMVIRGAQFGLLVSRFNSFIVDSLVNGAVDTLKRHGAEDKDIQIVRVPGAGTLTYPRFPSRIGNATLPDSPSAF